MLVMETTWTVKHKIPQFCIWFDAIAMARLKHACLLLSTVYALHYKSWREVLRAALENATTSNFFIGKGGVVSLSTKTNNEKKSVPVTFQ